MEEIEGRIEIHRRPRRKRAQRQHENERGEAHGKRDPAPVSEERKAQKDHADAHRDPRRSDRPRKREQLPAVLHMNELPLIERGLYFAEHHRFKPGQRIFIALQAVRKGAVYPDKPFLAQSGIFEDILSRFKLKCSVQLGIRAHIFQ